MDFYHEDIGFPGFQCPIFIFLILCSITFFLSLFKFLSFSVCEYVCVCVWFLKPTENFFSSYYGPLLFLFLLLYFLPPLLKIAFWFYAYRWFACMRVWVTCMSSAHPKRPEGSTLGLELWIGNESSHGCLKFDLGPLGQQPTTLITELPLQPYNLIFNLEAFFFFVFQNLC